MAIVSPNDMDGVLRSISDLPPTHYTVKIQLFSSLTKNDIERYDSGEFEAGGYKWKLVICPNGNNNKNAKEHISVYLAMAEECLLDPGWEVYAIFRLFLLDHNKNNYLTLEDSVGKGRCFNRTKLEWGFDQFIHHNTFNDPSNGFVADDSCVFGAEVFICKESRKGKAECLNMIKDGFPCKHSWKVENISKLDHVCHDSKTFNGGGYKWKMQLYPGGKGNGMGSHLSFYLALAEPASMSPGSKVLVELTLRLWDMLSPNDQVCKATNWFSSSSQDYGWSRFISLDSLYQPTRGFITKDGGCWVHAEMTILGVAGAL